MAEDQASEPLPPPDFVAMVGRAEEDCIDLEVLAAGVVDAERELARVAALQLANGLYPVSIFGMLPRLKALRLKIASAQEKGVELALVEGGGRGAVVKTSGA